MNEFENVANLKKPDEITKPRFINPDNQMCKGNACKLAKKHDVVWGVD